MAKMITRTILGTKASVITVDTTNMTASTKDFTIGGEWADNNKLLKALKKTYETDTMVLSAIVKTEKIEKLYGMTEELFMANAVELDAETRKPLTVNPTDTAVSDDVPTDNGVAITAPITVTEVSAKAEKIDKKNK